MIGAQLVRLGLEWTQQHTWPFQEVGDYGSRLSSGVCGHRGRAGAR